MGFVVGINLLKFLQDLKFRLQGVGFGQRQCKLCIQDMVVDDARV